MESYFDICIHGENGHFSLSETEVYRLVCHALVQQLPERAFKEAVEALNDIYDFYREPPARPVPIPQHTVKGRIAGTVAAPVFPLMED